MAIITRAELVKKYKIATAKVAQLEKKEYKFKTNRACEPFGKVQLMTISDVVKAGASIHDGDRNITERIEQYGVKPEDLKNADARKYLGFSIEDWDHDFALRVEQIHDKSELETYKKVAKKLSANFTDEDRFIIEMGEIDDLGVDLSDTTETIETAETAK